MGLAIALVLACLALRGFFAIGLLGALTHFFQLCA
jgi:hypothetical protein